MSLFPHQSHFISRVCGKQAGILIEHNCASIHTHCLSSLCEWRDTFNQTTLVLLLNYRKKKQKKFFIDSVTDAGTERRQRDLQALRLGKDRCIRGFIKLAWWHH